MARWWFVVCGLWLWLVTSWLVARGWWLTRRTSSRDGRSEEVERALRAARTSAPRLSPETANRLLAGALAAAGSSVSSLPFGMVAAVTASCAQQPSYRGLGSTGLAFQEPFCRHIETGIRIGERKHRLRR